MPYLHVYRSHPVLIIENSVVFPRPANCFISVHMHFSMSLVHDSHACGIIYFQKSSCFILMSVSLITVSISCNRSGCVCVGGGGVRVHGHEFARM